MTELINSQFAAFPLLGPLLVVLVLALTMVIWFFQSQAEDYKASLQAVYFRMQRLEAMRLQVSVRQNNNKLAKTLPLLDLSAGWILDSHVFNQEKLHQEIGCKSGEVVDIKVISEDFK